MSDLEKMETLVNIENGEIQWDLIKKLLNDSDIDSTVKMFKCKMCGNKFYSKTYLGDYPLCKKHLNSVKKNNN